MSPTPKTQTFIQHIPQTENSKLALTLFGLFQFMKYFYHSSWLEPPRTPREIQGRQDEVFYRQIKFIEVDHHA